MQAGVVHYQAAGRGEEMRACRGFVAKSHTGARGGGGHGYALGGGGDAPDWEDYGVDAQGLVLGYP